jgi:hypothetical protein
MAVAVMAATHDVPLKIRAQSAMVTCTFQSIESR